MAHRLLLHPGYLRRSPGISLLILLLLFVSMPLSVWAAQQSVSATVDYSAAHALLDYANAARAQNGLAPLAFDYNLESFALQRAAEVSILNSHTRPDGSTFGYGENYAIGQASAADANASFLASSAHAANILNAGYTGMAAGVVFTNGRYHWVEIFSSGSDTGVANGYSGQVAATFTVNVADNSAALQNSGNYDDTLQIRPGTYIMAGGRSAGVELQAQWSSSNPAVVGVDGSGKISGYAEGSAVITANFGNVVKHILVVVHADTPSGSPAPAPAAPLPATQNSLVLDVPPAETNAATPTAVSPVAPSEGTAAPVQPSTENTTGAGTTNRSETSQESKATKATTARSSPSSLSSASVTTAVQTSLHSLRDAAARGKLGERLAGNLLWIALAGLGLLGSSTVLVYNLIRDFHR